MDSPFYPPLLKEIASPPKLLYVKGKLETLIKPQLAIVGSRHPSVQGVELAYKFAKHLASLGFVITSGLALGVDAAGHRGALAMPGGQTVAVFGCGIDVIYPAAHKELATEIIDNGAIISEFPPGIPPKGSNFPRRNRIISGLSLGVLVVEAAYKSGSLITARMATDEGREVFAIPGAINNTNSKGCNYLIRQGAKLVETVDDILEEFEGLLKTKRKVSGDLQKQPIAKPPLDDNCAKLLSCIDFAATPVDIVISRSKLMAEEVGNILAQLELDGYITSVPGGYTRQL